MLSRYGGGASPHRGQTGGASGQEFRPFSLVNVCSDIRKSELLEREAAPVSAVAAAAGVVAVLSDPRHSNKGRLTQELRQSFIFDRQGQITVAQLAAVGRCCCQFPEARRLFAISLWIA
jgi:hypothetical protein